MRVVVITGSRWWPYPEPLEHALRGAELAILGDATGADTLSLEICLDNDIIAQVYCASPRNAQKLRAKYGHRIGVYPVSDWDVDGRTGPDNAGFIRNGAMLHRAMAERDAGMPVDCYAAPLPKSSGTYHCRRILKGQGFMVETLRPPGYPPPQRAAL